MRFSPPCFARPRLHKAHLIIARCRQLAFRTVSSGPQDKQGILRGYEWEWKPICDQGTRHDQAVQVRWIMFTEHHHSNASSSSPTIGGHFFSGVEFGPLLPEGPRRTRHGNVSRIDYALKKKPIPSLWCNTPLPVWPLDGANLTSHEVTRIIRWYYPWLCKESAVGSIHFFSGSLRLPLSRGLRSYRLVGCVISGIGRSISQPSGSTSTTNMVCASVLKGKLRHRHHRHMMTMALLTWPYYWENGINCLPHRINPIHLGIGEPSLRTSQGSCFVVTIFVRFPHVQAHHFLFLIADGLCHLRPTADGWREFRRSRPKSRRSFSAHFGYGRSMGGSAKWRSAW